ncbi:hypothetical protein MEBOL_005602 [Melittangium boletus DSM 14713]|uniref:Uncharacterized protein n=1 Tax=Melittangium boletus DSM 14713 TaxID=1294270 RepID=A0A250IMF1_9BACT|nr:hypothetical protein MEBOL_005602 [Melittangium boletus DSM 14713]
MTSEHLHLVLQARHPRGCSCPYGRINPVNGYVRSSEFAATVRYSPGRCPRRRHGRTRPGRTPRGTSRVKRSKVAAPSCGRTGLLPLPPPRDCRPRPRLRLSHPRLVLGGRRTASASRFGGGGNRTRAGRCETPSRIAPLPRNRPECLGLVIPPRPLLSRLVPGHSAGSCDIRATWRTIIKTGSPPTARQGKCRADTRPAHGGSMHCRAPSKAQARAKNRPVTRLLGEQAHEGTGSGCRRTRTRP